MNKCELCKSRARIFCESDQASLCWDCDVKVHSANFLVARHSRTLLCHACQSLTPWTANGSKLGRSFCVCQSCITPSQINNNMHDDDDAQSQISFNDQESDTNDDDEQDDEDEDEDNQVVPWTSEEEETLCGRVHAKRMRPNVSDLGSQIDEFCTSEGEDRVADTRKSLKHRRIRRSVEDDEAGAIDLNT